MLTKKRLGRHVKKSKLEDEKPSDETIADVGAPYSRRGKKERVLLRQEREKARHKKKIMKPPTSTQLINKDQSVVFKGSRNLRMRLICSVLSGQSIRITDIRGLSQEPGLKDYEVSFIRLLDKLSNGCDIRINTTGTGLRFKPGILVGGEVTHECPPSRSVGYYAELLVCLAPFCKSPLELTLRGVTNHSADISVDILRTVTLPLLRRFGLEGDLELKVKKRGSPPLGGGEIILRCPVASQLKPIDLLDEGKIKRFRGLAFTTKCSPQFATRMVESARSLLNHWIPDVYIYADSQKGKDSGLSPGFGLSLVSQSTTGILLSADLTATAGMLPEELGIQCAKLLCDEIIKGGCVDSWHQSIVLLLMLLCPEDVSRLRIGKLTPNTIECLRLYRDMFGTTFKITPDTKSGTVIMTCIGVGYRNYARKAV